MFIFCYQPVILSIAETVSGMMLSPKRYKYEWDMVPDLRLPKSSVSVLDRHIWYLKQGLESYKQRVMWAQRTNKKNYFWLKGGDIWAGTKGWENFNGRMNESLREMIDVCYFYGARGKVLDLQTVLAWLPLISRDFRQMTSFFYPSVCSSVKLE